MEKPKAPNLRLILQHLTPEKLFELFSNASKDPSQEDSPDKLEKLFTVFVRSLHTLESFKKEDGRIKEQYNTLENWYEQMKEEYDDELQAIEANTVTEEEKNKEIETLNTRYANKLFIAMTLLAESTKKQDDATVLLQRRRGQHALLLSYNAHVFASLTEEIVKETTLSGFTDAQEYQDFAQKVKEIYTNELKAYFDAIAKTMPEVPQEVEGTEDFTYRDGHWLVITDSDKEHYDKYLQELVRLSQSTPAGWCTGAGMERPYTTNGQQMHILCGRNPENPKQPFAYAAIRLVPNGEKFIIAEVRGHLPGQHMSLGTIQKTIEYLKTLTEVKVLQESINKKIQKLESLSPWLTLEAIFSQKHSDGTVRRYKETQEPIPLEPKDIPKALLDFFKSADAEQFEYFFGIKKPNGAGYGDVNRSVLDKVLNVWRAMRDSGFETFNKVYPGMFTKEEQYQKAKGNILSASANKIKDVYLGGENIKQAHKTICFANKGERPTKETRIIIGDYKYKEGDDLSNVIRITGDADFGGAQNITLPALREVGKDAFFTNAKNITLPKLERIGWYADFASAQNITLPALERIGGNANFIDAQNITLPALEGIGGYGYFASAQNITLPALERIGRDADFGGAQNITLPVLERIGGYANFISAQNITLPALERIGGNANFTGAQNILLHETLMEAHKDEISIPTNEEMDVHKRKIENANLMAEIWKNVLPYYQDFISNPYKYEQLKKISKAIQSLIQILITGDISAGNYNGALRSGYNTLRLLWNPEVELPVFVER